MSTFKIDHVGTINYSAKISTLGAALSELTSDGKNLIEPRIGSTYYSGVILAPWPNRISDGLYSYGGKSYSAEINEASMNNALHGQVYGLEWNLVEHKAMSVQLRTEIKASKQYPTDLDFLVTYSVSDDGLHCDLVAKNVGSSSAPYGASTHPYLVLEGLEKVDDYTLKIESELVLDVDPAHLRPVALIPVSELDFDFQESKKIGSRFIDHAFKLNNFNSGAVEVTSPDGSGIRINFDQESKWVQIHTADRTGSSDARRCLAVEPMTCPPNAFNSKIDLINLQIGESHSFSWSIAALN
jgi:aldose 1-epimerase